MAYIDNTQTKKEIEDAIRGNSVSNLAPSKVSDNVQLVCNVNPKDHRIINIVRRTNAAGTIYTTPIDKDFFLVGVTLAGSNNVASKSSSVSITATCKGEANTTIAMIKYSTSAILDVAGQCLYESFPIPIQLERNSIIALASTDGGALNGGIFGYTVEN